MGFQQQIFLKIVYSLFIQQGLQHIIVVELAEIMDNTI